MKFPYIFFGLFVLVGLAVAAYGLTVLCHARRSATWPGTPGVVTKSDVSRGDQSYAAAVAYAYTVDGVPYRGADIGSGIELASTTEDHARRRVARYPVGTPVAVYYDPAAPATAVLEPGVLKTSFVPLVFGLMFANFGGWPWLLWWLCEG